jgi:hypothetical protein
MTTFSYRKLALFLVLAVTLAAVAAVGAGWSLHSPSAPTAGWSWGSDSGGSFFD